MAMNVTATIKRTEAPHLLGAPKNGNVATQAMKYTWRVFVDGKFVGSYERLRDAKLLAGEFGCVPIIER